MNPNKDKKKNEKFVVTNTSSVFCALISKSVVINSFGAGRWSSELRPQSSQDYKNMIQ